MKNILIASIVALTSIPTLAAPLDCGDIASMAGTIMRSRQNGVTAPELTRIYTRNAEKLPKYSKLATSLIILAYDEPRMNVERNKQRMISEFESETFVACIKARR